MPRYAPGYTPSLPELVATRSMAETGVIQLDLVKIDQRRNSGARRLQQALGSMFADRPGSDLTMAEQVRLVLAARERSRSGALLM